MSLFLFCPLTFPVLPDLCSLFLRHGRLCGGRTVSGGVPGGGGVDLPPTNPQLSTARDHMVQRRAQDPPQQPHVIFSLYVDQSQLNGPRSHR